MPLNPMKTNPPPHEYEADLVISEVIEAVKDLEATSASYPSITDDPDTGLTFDNANGVYIQQWLSVADGLTCEATVGPPLRVKGTGAQIIIDTDHATLGLGFYGAAPIPLQTGVAVTAGAIHAALVALGLIAA